MRRRGFSLIECVVATFVLAVGFVAVASIYPMAHRGASVNANHVAAMQIASGVLAHIRSAPYGSTVSETCLSPETLVMVIEGTPGAVTFSKEVTFQRGGSTADTNAVADVASVTVTWTEGTKASSEGIRKSITVTGGVFREP